MGFFLRWMVGREKRGGLCSLKESSIYLAGLAAVRRLHGETGHAALLFLIAGPCLGLLCRQLEYSQKLKLFLHNFLNASAISLFLPFIYINRSACRHRTEA